jgi:hypothetical protein
LDILDLEEAVFIQYKPYELTWPGPMEFCVTEVKRDRDWFAQQLPVMDAFWNRVLWHREHGVEELLNKPKRTRKTTKKLPEAPQPCIIKDCEDDEEYFSD